MAQSPVPLIVSALELEHQDRRAALHVRDLGGPGRFRAVAPAAVPLPTPSRPAEEPNRHD